MKNPSEKDVHGHHQEETCSFLSPSSSAAFISLSARNPSVMAVQRSARGTPYLKIGYFPTCGEGLLFGY
jgi:hypothetical protein